MLLHQNASWGFHAENCLFLGRPKLCGVLMPSLFFLLGCVAASCGGEAVLGLSCEVLTGEHRVQCVLWWELGSSCWICSV